MALSGFSNVGNGYQVALGSLVADATVCDGDRATGASITGSPPAQKTAAVTSGSSQTISAVTVVVAYIYTLTGIVEYTANSGASWVTIGSLSGNHSGIFGLQQFDFPGLAITQDHIRVSAADDGNVGATNGHVSIREISVNTTIPVGECLSAFPLTGTVVSDIDTAAKGLSARTHRQAAHTENPIELWYYRDSAWHLFPVQPLTGPATGLELTQVYKQPATLSFTLPDPMGLYAVKNLASAYNLNALGVYDPLLNEARKICLRVGTKCYSNLAAGIAPTSTLAPFAGALSLLTDGALFDISSSVAGFVEFTPSSGASFSLTVDLGASKEIRHAVIRFASNTNAATCTFPSSVQVSVSTDNVTFSNWPVRPVGGAGTIVIPAGDWADSPTGQTVEIAVCDLETHGRYVKFTVVASGTQTILIDELAVYGGSAFQILGCNLFTGYMGDKIRFAPDGSYECVAVDALKKLADNNGVFLTAAYRLTSAGGIELADIVYSLLTSTGYWRQLQTNGYDSPLTSSEIGWASGSGLTGLQYPLWQGQTNSMLGYCYELFGVVGWHFYADGNGVHQAIEPPYTQRLPDRVCIAAPDGNNDVRECIRERSGKLLRNEVVVQTGKSNAAGSGTIRSFEPNSVAQFGSRETRIDDPLASTNDLRQKVAAFFLRDYAWNLDTLSNVIRPQFETRLKQIFGFRAPERPSLYAADATNLRSQELWSLTSIRHRITYGKWEADAEWMPYHVTPVAAPNFTALNTVVAHTDQLTAVFDAITDPLVTSMRIYLSVTSEFKGFSVVFTTSLGGTSQLLSGLTPGQQVWVYLTSVDAQNNESLPSVILTAIPGSSSQSQTCYTIGDFTISSILTSGPDSQGYYTYQFLGLWTSPTCGFTQSWVGAYVGATPPANPDSRSSWPIHQDSFNWWAPDRIPSGKTWDRVTSAQLDFTFTFKSTTNLSGLKMYWRIWNSAATRRWIPVEGNFASCTVV